MDVDILVEGLEGDMVDGEDGEEGEEGVEGEEEVANDMVDNIVTHAFFMIIGLKGTSHYPTDECVHIYQHFKIYQQEDMVS